MLVGNSAPPPPGRSPYRKLKSGSTREEFQHTRPSRKCRILPKEVGAKGNGTRGVITEKSTHAAIISSECESHMVRKVEVVVAL